jgi:hypothetical protein
MDDHRGSSVGLARDRRGGAGRRGCRRGRVGERGTHAVGIVDVLGAHHGKLQRVATMAGGGSVMRLGVSLTMA